MLTRKQALELAIQAVEVQIDAALDDNAEGEEYQKWEEVQSILHKLLSQVITRSVNG